MSSEATAAAAGRQTRRFLWLYALAAAGGAVAYVPFLTVLLPVRVLTLGDAENISTIAYGASAASLANIGFGWASDRFGDRRPWIWAGMLLSSLLLVGFSQVDDFAGLLALIVVWQLALNMMLGPLGALAGDHVPDSQKGFLGGLLAFAPALGALAGALVTLPGLAEADLRLAIVAALVVAMVAPVLLFGRPHPMPQLMEPEVRPLDDTARPRGIVARMWLARLLVQIAEAALFAFLLLWFTSIDPHVTDNDTAAIFSLVLALSVPLALVTGRWSDRAQRPFVPLIAGSGLGAAGLVVMAMAEDLASGIAGYVLFGLATSVFLALHTSQTLRILPRPQTRGRDLGLFNLTNTVPSLIMPWLTLALVPVFGFDALFLLLAALSAGACLMLLGIRARSTPHA